MTERRTESGAPTEALAIRPFQPADLPAVAELLASAFPVAWSAQTWSRMLSATLFESPWADSRFPSYVNQDAAAGITGFIAGNVLRAQADGHDITLICAAHLAVAPSTRGQAAGPFLLRTLLNGPQDATITDSAAPTVRRLWSALGGRTDPLRSLRWMQVVRPAAWVGRAAATVARGRSPHALVPVHAVPLRPLAPAAFATRTWSRTGAETQELLRVDDFVSHAPEVAPASRVRLTYDVDFVQWLFGEQQKLAGADVTVLRRIIRRRGRIVGWFLCEIGVDGVGRVLQVKCRQRDAEHLLGELFAGAAAEGAVVLSGRVEPHLADALHSHDCVIGKGNLHLLHAKDPVILEALASSDLSVFDGEWWF
jgi:hypothetical protein